MTNRANTENTAGVNKIDGPLATLKSWVKLLFPTGVVATVVLFMFQNFILMPVISYNKNMDEFSVATEFRNITIHIRPQMVVRYGDTVILITHLLGFYEQETLYFSDGKASLTRTNQKYADRLMSHIHMEVRKELQAVGYSAKQIDEINGQLFIYMTMLCGVVYETRLGNSVQRYCIIEDDGIPQDCTRSSDKVQERLFDYEMKIDDDDVDSIDTSEEVHAIIDTVVDAIKDHTPW